MGIRIGDHLGKDHILGVLEKHIETEEKVKRMMKVEYKYKENAQAALAMVKESGEAESLDFNESYMELDEVYREAEKSKKAQEVLDMPETTMGETFRKLAKIKEILEG